MIIRELVTKISFLINDKGLTDLDKKMKNIAGSMDRLGKQMTLFVTVPLAALGAGMIKAASDAQETQNRFNQVFRDLSQEADQWSKSFADSVGRSEFAIKDGLSSFQAFFVGLGFGAEEAAEMSKRLQTLSIDFASFNNLTDQESLQRFISGMSGSAEVFDRFGINLKASALDLELQAQGLAKSTAQATEQQKAVARLAIITRAMTQQGAVGDAVRTLGDFANRLKQTKALARDVAVEFGKVLIPVVNKILGQFLKFGKLLRGLSPTARKMILIIGGLAASIGPLLISLSVLIKTIIFVKGALALLTPQLLATAATFAPWLLLIGAISAAIALLVDDIANWVQGNQSVAGLLLGPWEDFARDFKQIWDDLGQFVEDFFFGVLTGNFDAFLQDLKLFLKTFEIFVDDIVKSIADKVQSLVKIPGFGKGLELAGGLVSGSTQRKAFEAGSNLVRGVLSSGRGATNNQRTVNVDSNVTVAVPPGMDAETVRQVETHARRAVDAAWNDVTRQLAVATPVGE